MSHKILFLGKKYQAFQFCQQVIDKSRYHLFFRPLREFQTDSFDPEELQLIIVDAIPLSNDDLHLIYSLKRESSYSHIPILAFVDSSPARLRYRLVEMGADDYLVIPFDKLDLQIKVKNLISKPGRQTGQTVEPTKSVDIIKRINQLLKRFNLPLLSFNSEELVRHLLSEFKEMLSAHAVLLLESRDKYLLRTKYSSPEGLLGYPLDLRVANFLPIEKAVRLKEPTFLTNTSDENPFVSYIDSLLQVRTTGIIVYPLTLGDELNSILVIIKTDPEKFTATHYLVIQIFSELIRHAIYIEDIKRTEKQQLDREVWNFYYDFLERIVNKLDFGILVLDNKYRIKFLNEKAAQIFRVEKEDILHNPLTALLGEDEARAMFTFKQTHVDTLERPELKIEMQKEEKILLGYSVYQYTDEESGEDGYIISLKDITVRKELQEEKDRIERINSLGTMTTGIAHEIRNPLAGIKAIAQTMEEEMRDGDANREYLKRIIRQTNRLDDILKTLYAFARPAKPNRASHSIVDILREVTGTLEPHLKIKNIQLLEAFHSNLPNIYVDAEQIKQVISNVLRNSIDAIKSDGEIRLSAHSLENGYPISKEHFKSLIQGKSYVEIHIRDNGCGISQENLDKIFYPFFTTKMMATGLGLTIGYQTIKQNGGLIFLESEEHEGTDCYLILPSQKKPGDSK